MKSWIGIAIAIGLGCGAVAHAQSLDWKEQARAACARNGCDARLLIAIAIVETGGRSDPDDTWHKDKVSWGRFGMQTSTAAFHIYGPDFSDPNHLPAHLAIEVERVLIDPKTGPEIAAQHLAWCQNRKWVRQSKAPKEMAAMCWNPKNAKYPAKVMKAYKETSK